MGSPVERRVVDGLPVFVLLCEASFGGFGSDYKSVAVADQPPLFAAAIPRQSRRALQHRALELPAGRSGDRISPSGRCGDVEGRSGLPHA